MTYYSNPRQPSSRCISRSEEHTSALPTSRRFRAKGGDGARLAADGNVVVECIPIDDLLFESAPTFIKMYIEGAELDALEGARHSIRTHRPILSICAYHKQDD